VEVRTDDPVAAMTALDHMAEVEKTSLFGTAVHAVLRSAGVTSETLATRLRQTGLRVDSVEEVAPSLEDVFLDVVEQASR
jgi:ribosomal protein S11